MNLTKRGWQGAIALFVGSFCLLTSPDMAAGSSDDSAHKWLDRMGSAVDDLNYRGTMVYFRDGRVDTLRIIHRSDENGIRERIYSLDGQPREILRNENRVKCFFPDNEALIVQSQLVSRMMPGISLSRFDQSSSVYDFRVGNVERVAGHRAVVVEIRPRDEFRYGQKFWLEKETGMLLRSALLDTGGAVLQQLSFTDIELGAEIEDGELEAGTDGEAVSTTLAHLPETRHPDDREALWHAGQLPQGFQLSAVEQGIHEDDRAFEHLVYSDGLASVSVYIEHWDGESVPEESLQNLGPVHIFTRYQGSTQITVVGEVPAQTVASISRQMQPASSHALQ